MNTDKYFNFNLPEINTLSEVFWKAKPFPHVIIDNFFDTKIAKQLESEFPDFDNKTSYFRERIDKFETEEGW